MALDLETKNLSNEIGGWGNTHMFVVSTVCTYDGATMITYADENDIQKEGVFPLRQLKFDLDDHFEKGGFLLGPNIRGFDLPVLSALINLIKHGSWKKPQEDKEQSALDDLNKLF